MALLDVDGVQREASLIFVEDPQVGEYVIVHAGFALHKIDEESAMETINILREAAAAATAAESSDGES